MRLEVSELVRPWVLKLQSLIVSEFIRSCISKVTIVLTVLNRLISLKWSEMVWHGLTVWKHLISDWRFWNQTVQTSQTTRPSDLQTTRLLQTSQTTRPPDRQIIRPFQTTPDQSDHQTTRPLECQTSQTTRQPDPQTVRPLLPQSDQQTSRQSDQSDHQTIRPKDCQTIPDDSRSIRPPDHQIPRLLDQSDN